MMQLEISNAPAWDGVHNRVRSDSTLLAAAASGEYTALPGAPFELSRQSVGCVTSGPSCGARPEIFALSFQGHCNTCETDPSPVRVDQGRSGNMGINGLDYLARNLRSYESGACDDSWNYAWTVREIWLE